ncbi:arsenite efflux MFS transporter ArsK [Rhizobium halophytocola]|uniref:Arsenite efflux MFS transporter ArsK n=1 Tax=Rhizobium halophytocola TaxID=735519 RepID=A0ABS4DZP9_9HYPH|nr:arsenite efflux MFS transporter ArsK [Rhizobium halophytocola]MBP1851171.1 hypothetical protein [Rhizobium halophytocola]
MTRERVDITPVLLLGLTQIIGYGTLYYSFSILASDMASDFSWPREWLFATLSIALVVGGFTAPLLGELFERIGAGRVMVLGSALCAAALALCALAPVKSVFVGGLVAAEIAANLVQYGAAFALLVQLNPHTASRSITYLTLIAGFASTVFWPLTTALHARLDWQAIYLIFAGLNLFVCLPVHAYLAGRAGHGARTRKTVSGPVAGVIAGHRRRHAFLLMAIAFALQGFLTSAMLIHMVPLLSGLGLGASAALVGTVFGPSQVASRLINMTFGQRLPPIGLALVSAALMPVGILILWLSAPSLTGGVAFAIIFGMGNGILSIASGTLPLFLFGSEGYGRLQGRAMSARLILSASAPFVLAVAMQRIGVGPALAGTTALGALPVMLLLAIGLSIWRRPGLALKAGAPTADMNEVRSAPSALRDMPPTTDAKDLAATQREAP